MVDKCDERDAGQYRDEIPAPPLSKWVNTHRETRYFDSRRRKHHKARPNTARPTASAGTRVTMRLPSGVAHDTAPAVTKAAMRPMAMAARGNLGCERSR